MLTWKKKKIFLILITFTLASYQLIKNIKEPEYFLQGFLSTTNPLKTKSLRFAFFSIHIDQEKMPYAAGRIFLRDNLTTDKSYFILDRSNTNILQKNRPFPKTFNLKVRLNEKDKFSLDDKKLMISQSINGLEIKAKNINIVF